MAKGMDDAKAYALAKRLEKYFRDQGHPMAHRLSRRIAEMLAYRVAVRLRTAAALKADTLALALLLEEPGASDAEIARRAKCSIKTLQRSQRYQTARALLRAGKSDLSRPS